MTTAIVYLLVTGLGMPPAPQSPAPPFPVGQSPAPVSASPIAQTPEKVQGLPGMTEIDGGKNPELIPDHLIWRTTFVRLAEIRRRGEEADLADLLPLSKADLATLYTEVMKQRGRDEDCEARYRAKEAVLKTERTPASAAEAALDEILIDCRTQVLDAADRVLDAVSDEGRQILLDYHESHRRSTSVLVPQSQLKNFRLPR
jgi:hypothetical protein